MRNGNLELFHISLRSWGILQMFSVWRQEVYTFLRWCYKERSFNATLLREKSIPCNMIINLLQQRCKNLKSVQSCATRCGNKNVALKIVVNQIIRIFKNILVHYCKWCNLIGYATRYLFVDRYRVTRRGRVFFRKKKQCLFLVFEIILKK